jgi:hypothetical protein
MLLGCVDNYALVRKVRPCGGSLFSIKAITLIMEVIHRGRLSEEPNPGRLGDGYRYMSDVEVG